MPAPYHNYDDATVTQLGRAILRYLLQLQLQFGQRHAAYRKVRIDLLRQVDEAKGGHSGFNWGFETVFNNELHVLEELGLIMVKYGSGAIMAGRTRGQIYNISLTDDGRETARIVMERDAQRGGAEKQRAVDTDAATPPPTGDPDDEIVDVEQTRPPKPVTHEDSTLANLAEADTIVNAPQANPADTAPPPPPKPSTAEIAPTGKLEPPQPKP